MLEAMQQIAQTVGGAAMVPLLYVAWRFERRLARLEGVVEMILAMQRGK